jgi:hypothetical protein
MARPVYHQQPLLGTLICFPGMRRINTRGIKLANKCMIMATIAYNIKKALKFKVRKVKAMAMVMERGSEGFTHFLFSARFITVSK